MPNYGCRIGPTYRKADDRRANFPQRVTTIEGLCVFSCLSVDALKAGVHEPASCQRHDDVRGEHKFVL